MDRVVLITAKLSPDTAASARRIEPTCEVARAGRRSDSEVFQLRLHESWADKSAYDATAKKLATPVA